MPKMRYTFLLSVSLEVNFLKEQLVVHLRCFQLDYQKLGHVSQS